MKIGPRAKVAIASGIVLCSATLMAFLGRWEGVRLTVYADTLAGGVPTVCRGLTKAVTNTPIIVGETWTREKCAREEKAALLGVQLELLECFDLSPPQSVLDGATSHAWNLSARKTCGSAAMKAWDRGDWELGCNRIARADDGRRVWSFTSRIVNGERVYTFVQGLANRRDAERELCMRDV